MLRARENVPSSLTTVMPLHVHVLGMQYRVRAAAALKKAMGRGGGDDSSDPDRSDSNSSSEVAALRQRLTAAQDELKSTTAALRSEQEAVRALTVRRCALHACPRSWRCSGDSHLTHPPLQAKLEQREEEAADEVAAAVQRAEQAETQLRDSQALWQKNLEEGLAESNDAARSTANQLQAEVAVRSHGCVAMCCKGCSRRLTLSPCAFHLWCSR